MKENWWMAYCDTTERPAIERAILSREPRAKTVFVSDAQKLRGALKEGEPQTVSVAIGPTTQGISSINLAAALAQDGYAQKVWLLGHKLSGSERSRARRAGIDAVVDLAQVSSKARLSEVAASEPAFATSKPSSESSSCTGSREPKDGAEAGEGVLLQTQLQYAHSQDSSTTPLIAVSSGRGGVGKTTFCALAALTCASWDMRVALVDADLVCGNLFTLFGLSRPPVLDADISFTTSLHPEQFSAQETSAVHTLMARGVEVTSNLYLFGPCKRPELSEKITPYMGAFLSKLRQAYDLVLVDTSAVCTDAIAQAFQLCNRLLLIHDENNGAIGSLSRAAQLAIRLGVARTQIVRVANYGDRHVRFDISVGRGELGLETARAFRLLDGGREVGELLAAGKAQELFEIGDQPCESIASLLARMLDDLGCLPDVPQAHEALEESLGKRRKLHLWRRAAG